METALSFLEYLPSNWFRFIFLGTNQKENWFREAGENSVNTLNKFRHQTKRQVEFIIRVLIFGVIFYFLNDLFLMTGIQMLFELLLKQHLQFTGLNMIISIGVCLFIECIITLRFYVINFKKGLIGIDLCSKQSEKLTYPFVIENILFFILIFIRFYWQLISVCLFLVCLLGALLYCCFLLITVTNYRILDFTSGSRYNSTDYPLLHKDIYLNMKTGEEWHKRINLLEMNLYICDNDDILLFPRNGEPEVFKKENIESIQIKNKFVEYRNNKWELT